MKNAYFLSSLKSSQTANKFSKALVRLLKQLTAEREIERFPPMLSDYRVSSVEERWSSNLKVLGSKHTIATYFFIFFKFAQRETATLVSL